MGSLQLAVKVLNISPKATAEDLTIFFSYCGTIDKLKLQRDGDQSQLAIVTFRQPYALQTALLLNDAVVLGRRLRILPLLDDPTSVPISWTSENMNDERDGRGFIPAALTAARAAELRGQEALNKAQQQVMDTGRMLTHSAISAAEQAAATIGSAIASHDCAVVSKGALWLSSVLDRASKSVAELGNVKGKITTFSSKEK